MNNQLKNLNLETLFDYQQSVNLKDFHNILAPLFGIADQHIHRLWIRFSQVEKGNLLTFLHQCDSRVVDAFLADIRKRYGPAEQVAITVTHTLYFAPGTPIDDAKLFAEEWAPTSEEVYLNTVDFTPLIIEDIATEVKHATE